MNNFSHRPALEARRVGLYAELVVAIGIIIGVVLIVVGVWP